MLSRKEKQCFWPVAESERPLLLARQAVGRLSTDPGDMAPKSRGQGSLWQPALFVLGLGTARASGFSVSFVVVSKFSVKNDYYFYHKNI